MTADTWADPVPEVTQQQRTAAFSLCPNLVALVSCNYDDGFLKEDDQHYDYDEADDEKSCEDTEGCATQLHARSSSAQNPAASVIVEWEMWRR